MAVAESYEALKLPGRYYLNLPYTLPFAQYFETDPKKQTIITFNMNITGGGVENDRVVVFYRYRYRFFHLWDIFAPVSYI